MDSSVLLAVGGGLLAVLFAGALTAAVLRLPQGNERMVEIASAIQEGAAAYLNRQYTVIAIIGVLIAIVIGLTLGVPTAILYLIGAACSAAAGYVGMNVSVRANLRTAEAARQGLGKALAVAFRGGAVTGFMVVGLGIGLLVLFRERLNHQGRLAKGLAKSVYTVYLIHPVVLVGFAYAFHVVMLYPLLKCAIAVLVTIPLCFLISSGIRRIPLVNRVV